MTLTKADLINKVYHAQDMSKVQAFQAVEAFLMIAKDSLVNGEDVLFSGFGKFSVKDKKARSGRNPQTGAELILDARRVVTFKPSGQLRTRCNHETIQISEERRQRTLGLPLLQENPP